MNGVLWRVNPAFLAWEANLKAKRKKHRTGRDPTGAGYCRTEIIEPTKAQLRRPFPNGVVSLIGADDPQQRYDAVQFIEAYCRLCGLCEVKNATTKVTRLPHSPEDRRSH